jgi:hypothetical protein
MSDNSAAITLANGNDENLHGILRYSIGSAIIMMVALGYDYQLAYFTPVLALNFLAPTAKAPTLKSSAAFLLSVGVASLAGVIFSRFFLDYPLVFLPLLALILFHIYYTTALQGMKVWLIISLLLIPMMSLQSAELGRIVAVNLFVNALLALLLVWVIYFIFPVNSTIVAGDKKAAANQPSARQRFVSALSKSMVVIPVVVMFFVFNWSGSILILFFIAILSMNPASANKKTSVAMILANLGGGLAAIVAFNLLTAATSFIYSGILTLLVGLLFAKGLFSHKPAAPLFGMAFSTFLLILGNVISLAGEAGDIVWARIFQIGVAMVYMVIAFRLIDRMSLIRKLSSSTN